MKKEVVLVRKTVETVQMYFSDVSSAPLPRNFVTSQYSIDFERVSYFRMKL